MGPRMMAVASAGSLALASGCTYILDIQHDYTAEGAAAGGDGPASIVSTGSTDDSGGTGGAGGAASACPAGPGPAMVDVGGFCVDATEVTNGAYAAWLATGPSTGGEPAACSFNKSFVPKASWPAAPSDADKPVAHVNWCDARAYCVGVGKRLCGRRGGGTLAFDAFDDAAESEWMTACSNGGTTRYPYGDTYKPSMCNGKDAPGSQLAAAGAEPGCHGVGSTYEALFDMSGNVGEWEDACSGASGPNDACRRRGGSYKEASVALRCESDSGMLPRSWTSSTTGFRCCAD